MDEKARVRFVSLWRKYFGDAELPLVVCFADKRPQDAGVSPESERCIINMLPVVQEGKTLCFSAEDSMCGGAKRYLGFAEKNEMRDLDYFLSYGIPGKVVGERYKKTPELVREGEKFFPPLKAPKKFIVFKRWDKVSSSDEVVIVFFLADLNTIAGLFTLANFDEAEPNEVICPFGSGCASIVYHPYRELGSARPRCVLGMFDITAKPCIGRDRLSFAIPLPKFQKMVDNMDESFLTTDSWKVLRERDE